MSFRGLVVVSVLVTAGCASNSPPTDTVATAEDGRAVLERACTVCHDLGGLTAFADFWAEPEWRSLMDTMVSYGATLTPFEYELLAAYLAEEY